MSVQQAPSAMSLSSSISPNDGRCGMCGSCNSAPPWSPEHLELLDIEGRARVLRELEEKVERWKREHRRNVIKVDKVDEETNGMVEIGLDGSSGDGLQRKGEMDEPRFKDFTGAAEDGKDAPTGGDEEVFVDVELRDETEVVIEEKKIEVREIQERGMIFKTTEETTVASKREEVQPEKKDNDSESDDSFVTAPPGGSGSLELKQVMGGLERIDLSGKSVDFDQSAKDEGFGKYEYSRRGSGNNREQSIKDVEKGRTAALRSKSTLEQKSLSIAHLRNNENNNENNSEGNLESLTVDGDTLAKSPTHSQGSAVSPNTQEITECADCPLLRKRIAELEQHVQSLEAALAAKDMSIAALKGTVRSVGQSGRRERELQLRQEVESLRVTCDFLYRRLQSSDPSKRIEPQVH